MKNRFSLVSSLSCGALVLASCQQQAPLADTWGALPVLDRVELEYFGTLNADASQRLEIPEFESLSPTEEELRTTPQWLVRARMISLGDRAVARLIGESIMFEGDELSGGVVDAERANEVLDAMVEAGDGSEINAPRVLVLEGQRGVLTVINQVAYIDSFDFERTPQALIGDPEVGVFGSGVLLDVRPLGQDEQGYGVLSFALTWSELLEMSEVESSFPHGAAPVTVQVPVAARQDVVGQLRAKSDQAILLPVLYGSDEERILIMVEFASMMDIEREPAKGESQPSDDA